MIDSASADNDRYGLERHYVHWCSLPVSSRLAAVGIRIQPIRTTRHQAEAQAARLAVGAVAQARPRLPRTMCSTITLGRRGADPRNGGSGGASHVRYNGQEGADYRRVNITANSAEGSGAATQVAVFSIAGTAHFLSSDGAIIAISYSEDSILFSGEATVSSTAHPHSRQTASSTPWSPAAAPSRHLNLSGRRTRCQT